MLYVLLDVGSNLTKVALVDSKTYISASAQKALDNIKQKAPNNTLKTDDHPNFRIQVPNGQLAKLLATTTFYFDIGDNTITENFVVMKKLTGPVICLHFMRITSVVIATTHGPTHIPHLTVRNKTTSEVSAKPQQAILTDDTLSIPPRTTKTITTFVDHPSNWNTTDTVTPLAKCT